MSYVFMAGVADVDLFVGDQLLGTAKTLSDSSISISTSSEEIRAGKGAKLYGRFFHTSAFTLTLQDVMFRMDYIALNIGANIEIGGDGIVDEEVTTTVANQITVTGTPVKFDDVSGIIGWYTLAGKNDWTKVTFVGQSATVANLPVGTKVCVKYTATNDAMELITVSGNIVPSEIKAVLKGDLFLGEKSDISSSSKVGQVQIEVPRLQLNGAVDLSMSMTGVSNTSLSGVALATTDGGSCTNDGYYSKIKKTLINGVWFEKLQALAVQDTDMDFTATTLTDTVVTYGVFKDALSKVIKPSLLTYTITGTDSAKFAINATTGVITCTATANATAQLSVKVKDATGNTVFIESIANLTYTA